MTVNRAGKAGLSPPRRLLRTVLVGALAIGAARLLIEKTPLADWVVSPLVAADAIGPVDAIVVAGAGVIGECEPNNNGVRRVLLAARLFRQQVGHQLVFTGGTGQPCAVSVAMARLAVDIGVPRSAIWMETGSRSTRENAELSAPTLRALGARRVLVVTDRLHGPRATGAFRQMGFEVTQATVPIYAGHPNNVSMLFAGLREYAALAYYRLRGWTLRSDSQVRARESDMSGDMNGNGVQPPSARPVADAAGPIALLGASYAAGWSLSPISGAPVINLGVGGQQSFEMLERFERDVVPLRPRAVILWGFVNDVFRSEPGNESTLTRVRESYSSMVSLARDHGIAPVIATEVTIRPPRTWQDTAMGMVASLIGKQSYQDRINRDVIALNEWLVDLARREGLLLLDLQSTLAGSGGQRRPEFATEDGSHISPAGYAALSVYARPLLEDHLVVRQSGS